MHFEAACAGLCGNNPLPAGSGKSKTEAIRCLERYVARETYNAVPSPAAA